MNTGVISYLAAFLAFLFLTLLLLTSWRSHEVGRRIMLATILSTIWACVSTLAALNLVPPISVPWAELGKDLAWLYFLVLLIEAQSRDAGDGPRPPWRKILVLMGAYALVAVVLIPVAALAFTIKIPFANEAILLAWLSLSIFGLLLIEQFFRSTNAHERWAIKHLCLGLGILFAYDFFLFADTLLFKHLDANLWVARGGVSALVVPLIALSIARNPKWNLRIHVSRQIVYHSATLLGAGLYLIAMAGMAYVIRAYGGNWGTLLQILFFVAAVVLLLVLLFSDDVRAKVRVLLNKHFFSLKYDYRQEWLRFTNTLAAGDAPVPERIVHAIADMVGSKGGALWALDEHGHFCLLSRWDMPEIALPNDEATLLLKEFLEQQQWIIDIPEYAHNPALYGALELPDILSELPDAWLIVPLLSRESLIGIVLLKKSELTDGLNWEDRDLLKMAAQQAASHLAQYLNDQALMQARQFEAFNRLSAYVVHDLKNILAQQSLLVANAEKHKGNPAFIEDMIGTVRNSVERMTRLMEQMRSGIRGAGSTTIDLNQLLEEVIARHSHRRPTPSLSLPGEQLSLTADPERLATVFSHLIQNAQDATNDDGRLTVRLYREQGQGVVEISDTGCGMDDDFIEQRLFRPFDSTKGLAGMGIGVFESREIIRALGGNIRVESTPGIGTTFRITIPLD